MLTAAIKQAILKVLSVFIIMGGLVRLAANRRTFGSFLIDELWVSHPYFIYIYRVLGAFVIFVGITIFIISQDPGQYSRVLKVWGYCFLFISIVMLVAGYLLNMSLLHYGIDSVFVFFVAVLCFSLGTHQANE